MTDTLSPSESIAKFGYVVIKDVATDYPSAEDNNELDPDFKAEWIAALESGKYQQTKEYLHRIEDGVDGFCCLGVVCDMKRDVFDKTLIVSTWGAENVESFFMPGNPSGYSGMLPEELWPTLGFKSSGGSLGIILHHQGRVGGMSFESPAEIDPMKDEPPFGFYPATITWNSDETDFVANLVKS